MAAPIPPRLDELGDRLFSFYPPVIGVDHNEWSFLQSNWAEILVRNPKSGIEIWIPRSYVGEISKIEDPVMIVGLKKELEYKSGAVWPYKRRVIPMPANPVSASPRSGPAPRTEFLASVLRLDGGAESGVTKAILIALVSASWPP